MKKKLIVGALLPMLILPFSSELSYSQPKQLYNNHNPPVVKQMVQVDPEVLKVSKITGWNIEISKFFVSEAKARKVKVFEEALPILTVETRNQFMFDKVHKNIDGSLDKGLFQINDTTYKDVVAILKAEGRQFESWSRLNPKFNIAAGILWIACLKDNYELESHSLFTSYNQGVAGARKYAKRNGTYVSRYSKDVEIARKNLLKY